MLIFVFVCVYLCLLYPFEIANQRIERFWLNVRESVIDPYKVLFFRFITVYGMKFDTIRDLYCLHYVFLKRINQHLEQFRQIWNSHILRTTKRSPDQLCYLSRHDSKSLNPLSMIVENDENHYIENENDRTYSKVNTIPVRCELTKVQFNYFKNNVFTLDLSHIEESVMWQHLEAALVMYDYCVDNL